MKIIIFFIVVLLVIIGIGLFLRKKIYDEVDRLESWKIDVMNRPITDEIARVKELVMNGQTEERFEQWRQVWDEIITVKLPDVEELLFDAEEAADKYRYVKAKDVIKKMETILIDIEASLKNVLEEIDELVNSEEKNNQDIAEIQDRHKKLRKILLAHGHTFGKASEKLNNQLDKLSGQFQAFNELTSEGNYLEARNVVAELIKELDQIQKKIDLIPGLLSDCQNYLPAEIKELKSGHQEMVEKGYSIEIYGIEHELNNMEEELQTFLKEIDETEVDAPLKGIKEMKERIGDIYSQLEREVQAKIYVQSEASSILPVIERIQDEFSHTKDETKFVQQSYHIEDQDLATEQQIEKQLKEVVQKYNELKVKMEDKSFPFIELKEGIDDVKEQIESLHLLHEGFKTLLSTLRKDEITAKDQVGKMRKKILDAKRLISKSNLPGLPASYMDQLEEAEDSLVVVIEKLKEKPLEIPQVNRLLQEAMIKVDSLYNATEELIEQVHLVEKVIQYGNRYRSSNAIVASKLIEAEEAFRRYDYDNALEEAATAVEGIEPGALKRVEQLLGMKDQD